MKAKRPARKFRQEVDANVFRIGFSTLLDKAEIATGDPNFCKTCNAVFNKFSKLKPVDEDSQIWKCEFCLTENLVSIEEGEQPQSNAVNYLLEAAA
jgi:hypothetical protein